MNRPTLPLTDEQMRNFIINGYVKVKTDFSPNFHANIRQQLDTMFEETGNLGNNLLPAIPEIQEVFDHPAVHGAMQGVLGSDYVMHPHRYCHFNQQGSEGQNFHKDSYAGDEQIRRHRCRWTMAFYYPQDVTEDMGATAVLPGSQYYETGESAHEQPEIALCGEAGTVTIVHYDLWHRAMPNRSDKKRYMLKFLFIRLDEPQAPLWQSHTADWHTPSSGEESEHPELWESVWDWHYGKQNGTANGVPHAEVNTLIETLDSDNEKERLNAAYRLGRVGAAAVPVLKQMLHSESNAIREYAGYALSLTGAPAVSTLIDALQAADDSVRASAAFALADMGKAAQEALPALVRAAQDPSESVRRHATEGLGLIGQLVSNEMDVSETVQVLATGLSDAYLPVRDNAARALAKFGTLAEPAMPALVTQLEDEDRYVRFHAALALKQVQTPEAQDVLFNHLFTSRWCALTTRGTPF
ncbi:phytanoyl-CoA dioxygenase [Candidatus Poribacteria bacterium]|nr:phytanoyl-CoA dioxygenase [Candidatus Poribacteria bacterium]MYB00967.1 phytanoyl-CoA dioxygenase [Candidatus Poribacteria bacterium]